MRGEYNIHQKVGLEGGGEEQRLIVGNGAFSPPMNMYIWFD